MNRLKNIPKELFCRIIEELVLTVGLWKALRYRCVHRSFRSTIEQAICTTQVIDIFDPVFILLPELPPSLLGRIFLTKSRSTLLAKNTPLSLLADLNRNFGAMLYPTHGLRDEEQQCIAQAFAKFYPKGPFRGDSPVTDRNRTYIKRKNFLSGAIILGRLDIVDELLANDGNTLDMKAMDPLFGFPLALAASHGHIHIVRRLLELGTDPIKGHDFIYTDFELREDQDWDLESPIRLRRGQALRSPYGSALQCAVRGGYRDIVQLLLQPEYCVSTTKPEYFRCILQATSRGHLGLINLLLDTTGKRLSDYPHLANEMLLEATIHGHEHVVNMLLDSGVDVNTYPQHAQAASRSDSLTLASFQGNVSMVRLLLKRGAKVHVGSYDPHSPPIYSAVHARQVETMQLLLDHGADPAETFESAVRYGHAEQVKQVLTEYPDLVRHKNGYTAELALRTAIGVKNPKMISVLVDAGVPLNTSCDFFGDGHPVKWAKMHSVAWIVQYLIALGADDDRGKVPKARMPFYQEEEEVVHQQPSKNDVRVVKRTCDWLW